MRVEASGQGCGACVTGISLHRPLSCAQIEDLRSAWLQYHVLTFPDQDLSDDDLERLTQYFGPFADDPFIAPIEGRQHIVAIERQPHETSPLFAENWNSEWSFVPSPPIGTLLYAKVVPPIGGDTLFANQHMALDLLPDHLLARIDGLRAVHSARAAFAPGGLYGRKNAQGSMAIHPSSAAMAAQIHPFVKRHAETGQAGLYGCMGYIIGFEGIEDADAHELMRHLYQHQTQVQVQYRHKWRAGSLVMWDNRSVLHAATGGYEGYHRLLHRTTIGSS